jgi:hypothetical protein
MHDGQMLKGHENVNAGVPQAFGCAEVNGNYPSDRVHTWLLSKKPCASGRGGCSMWGAQPVCTCTKVPLCAWRGFSLSSRVFPALY